jgi:uncharacterized protein
MSILTGIFIFVELSMIAENSAGHLSKDLCAELLTLARESLRSHLAGEPQQTKSPDLPHRGLFVTLRTAAGELRGCIGHVTARCALDRAICTLTPSAAKDQRFAPVRKEDEADIRIELSVLTPLQKVEDLDEILVGRDGLVVTLGVSSGLLLPKVASERGWDRDEFLSATCHKAGLPMDCWRTGDLEISRFQCQVFSESDAGGSLCESE